MFKNTNEDCFMLLCNNPEIPFLFQHRSISCSSDSAVIDFCCFFWQLSIHTLLSGLKMSGIFANAKIFPTLNVSSVQLIDFLQPCSVHHGVLIYCVHTFVLHLC